MENRKCIQRMAVINGMFLRIFIACFFFYDSASAQLLSTPGGRILSTSSGKVLAAGATFSEVAILSISGVTDNTAIINATAISDGSTSITEKGLIWATSSLNLTYAANLGKKSFSGGAGNFNHALSALNPGTVYYVRAYVIVDGVTKYGAVRTFQTTPSAVAPFKCGDILTIKHTAGDVAPENVTINYKTVMTSLAGKSQCWITQNLGASNQASSIDDSSNDAAGWYWMFNRKQGYALTPTTTPQWVYENFDENSDWISSNDPCYKELGEGWRIPTKQEWYDANEAMGGRINNTFLSVLKLHEAGYLWFNVGVLAPGPTVGSSSRGTMGMIWSSTNMSNISAYDIQIINLGKTDVANYPKSYGLSVRCLKDNPVTPFNSCGDLLFVNHTQGNVAPETVQIAYGTVETDLAGSTQCWITQNLGASNQATSVTDATDAAAGWYWQFGRQQGYKVGPIPTWNLDTSFGLTDWLPENDPCSLLLGADWRIPTYAEFDGLKSGWTTYFDAYNSKLKLHAAGSLTNTNLSNRASIGYYWSSASNASTTGYRFAIASTQSAINTATKTYGSSVRCLKENIVSYAKCGDVMLVEHKTTNNVAPENINIKYLTVETNLAGSSQCWITQNLGAVRPSLTAQGNGTDIASGWYWQFNVKQGHKSSQTPSLPWIDTFNNSNWMPENDPCKNELGIGWRIPTYTEWNAVAPNFTGTAQALSSVLKLHQAGYMSNASIYSQNESFGYYWSSAQSDNSNGYYLLLSEGNSKTLAQNKLYGYSVRCLKDKTPAPFNKCGDVLSVVHQAGAVAPETVAINYNTVSTSLAGTSQCWITQNLGARKQASSETDPFEGAAGWYWRFNVRQGFKSGTTSPTPDWAGQPYVSSDWLSSEDPCKIELGSDWRIPTGTEWTNTKRGWSTYADAYKSVLKLHAAGMLDLVTGALTNFKFTGQYWSSTRETDNHASMLTINQNTCFVDGVMKKFGASVRCLKDNPTTPFIACGDVLRVTHTSPEAKQVDYNTVETNLGGSTQCWITQNLGASNQASSVTDDTEASAGWYYQFNRKQGYKLGPSPAWTIYGINELSDWVIANDPCGKELGTGWRIPTFSEWTKVISGWNNGEDSYNSVLKLHYAGFLNSSGVKNYIGTYGYYWCSVQKHGSYGYAFGNWSSGVFSASYPKANGLPVRCVKDNPPVTFANCGDLLTIDHNAGLVAPETRRIQYETVETDLAGTSQCWIARNLGATRQATFSEDTTEEPRGWYWQFNRKQGYKKNLGPTWNTTPASENSNWIKDNDPCALELGSDWRIPTKTELDKLQSKLNNYTVAFNSALKLYASGWTNTDGSSSGNINFGYIWSSTQTDATNSYALNLAISSSQVNAWHKGHGFSIRCLKDNTPAPFTTCGDVLTVVHRAGTVSPETKKIDYRTVPTNLYGASQCWIGQNLGAETYTLNPTDTNPMVAGWYWQFNRPQGFAYETNRIPKWTVYSISEDSNWTNANDPCSNELGTEWHIPTATDWITVSSGWVTVSSGSESVHRIHTAGYLDTYGALTLRGESGFYWSSDQNGVNGGYALAVSSSSKTVSFSTKAYGFSLRCIKSTPPPKFASCGDVLTVNHDPTNGVAPVKTTIYYKTIVYGRYLNGVLDGGCWITQNLGASIQASSVIDNSEFASGWYWQFNQKKAYKNWPLLVGTINTTDGWHPNNDPCTLELGVAWHIPTYSDWDKIYPGWTGASAFSSGLNLRLSGYIDYDLRMLHSVGSQTSYWSSASHASNGTLGYALQLDSGYSKISTREKIDAFPVRCIRGL